MKFPHRRQFLHLAAGAAALPAVSGVAGAQAYPTRPVTMVVPYPAGAGMDILGRIVAPHLSEHLGQQVIVENMGGTGGMAGSPALQGRRPTVMCSCSATPGRTPRTRRSIEARSITPRPTLRP